MLNVYRTIGDTVMLGVMLTESDAPLIGLSPTVEVRRQSDDLYLDFSASSTPYWASSGGQREQTLTEQSWLPGYYIWSFNQALYEAGGKKEDYNVVYRNPLPYRLLEVEVVTFANEAVFDVEFIRKMLANYQTLLHKEGEPDELIHEVFDDDKSTLIYHADITLEDRPEGQTEIRDPV